MQVALLHYTVPPTIGGVEFTIAAHARLLREHGYAVKLVAGRGDDALLVPELDSRHPRVQKVQDELNRGQVPPDFEVLTTALVHALEDALDNTDLVIAHNIATLHKNLAGTAALHTLVQSNRINLIAWCHDLAWKDPVYEDDLYDGEPWDLMRRAWANTRYVVVSESRRGELARMLQLESDRIAVVPPGLDAAEFLHTSPSVARWLDELNLRAGAPLVLLAARITRRKNIELAIEIVRALREQGYTPKLVVMGPPGPHNPANRAYLEELKARADDMVIFLAEHGAVGAEERRDLYALADVLMFPSAREGFGIPILEAGLAGVPVFCADIPPFRESAQGFAYYFELDESPREIAARMGAFFDGDVRYRLKQRVRQRYSWETIFRERIEPLLQEYRAPQNSLRTTPGGKRDD